MTKNLNILRSKVIALSLAAGISLVPCSNANGADVNSTSNKNIETQNYNTADYSIIYVDGIPHLVYYEFEWFFNSGVIYYFDVNTDEIIGKFSNLYNVEKNMEFSNEVSSNLTRFAIIKLTDIIDNDTFSKETYQFLAEGGEKLDEYLDDNYEYDVNVLTKTLGEDETYKSELRIYEFNDELNNEKTYHIGYNANRIYESDNIYDIKDGKIYHIPDIGTYTFKPIDELYDDEKITVKQAEDIRTKDGDVINLSASMFMLTDPEVIYLSSGNYEEYMFYNSQYLIQWEMIKYGIEHGFKRYNFYGITGNFDKNDKDYGIYEFKTGFNGYVEELIGEYVYPTSFVYYLMQLIHKIKK